MTTLVDINNLGLSSLIPTKCVPCEDLEITIENNSFSHEFGTTTIHDVLLFCNKLELNIDNKEICKEEGNE